MERLRHQIAFYASTPSYRPVLDLHGCAKLGDRLHTMSRGGQWEEMAREVDDDVLDALAMTGTPQEAAVRTRDRWGQGPGPHLPPRGGGHRPGTRSGPTIGVDRGDRGRQRFQSCCAP